MLQRLTDLGDTRAVVVLAVVVAAIELWRAPSRFIVPFLVAVTLGNWLVTTAIKDLADRARPTLNPIAETLGPSFPSGHSSTAAAFFAAAALLLGRRHSPRFRAVLAGLAVGIAVMVAGTRVLMDVHWLSDTMAGVALGWSWFTLCAIAFGGRLLQFGAAVEEAADEAVATAAEAPAPRASRAAHRAPALDLTPVTEVSPGRRRGDRAGVTTSVAPEPVEEFSRTPLFEVLARAGLRGARRPLRGHRRARLPPRRGHADPAGEPARRVPDDRRPAVRPRAARPDDRRPARLRHLAHRAGARSAARRRRAATARSTASPPRQRRRRTRRSPCSRSPSSTTPRATRRRRRSCPSASSRSRGAAPSSASPGAVFVVMAAYQLFMAVTRRFCDDSKVGRDGRR